MYAIFFRDDRNDRYGPPTRTNYRLIVENLSSRVSWQVRNYLNVDSHYFIVIYTCLKFIFKNIFVCHLFILEIYLIHLNVS